MPEIIALVQSPVIAERLAELKASIEQKTGDALRLTDRAEIKRARAELNHEFDELETRRKNLKKEILKPYEEFEQIYRENCSNIYKAADAELKQRIDAVESALKAEKEAEIRNWFTEYRSTMPELNFVQFEDMGIRVNLSSSMNQMQDAIAARLELIRQDVDSIHDPEILAEYRNRLNLAQAISIVEKRRAAVEAARTAIPVRETVPEPPEPPEPAIQPVQPPEEVYQTSFTVWGTMNQLRKLKDFMNREGMQYE